ncbi:hypothetical protein BD626DRAFT_479164 [Schizophyllum amplum]|uniref:Uncharacterized protein n=1 Tax=Schizophyllum amplum TaxID=97359 RepID=A0A550CS05_9AGAR|nr:hypothetical protein BD626DRAFT_479164 [Auriculariopsis ampla]
MSTPATSLQTSDTTSDLSNAPPPASKQVTFAPAPATRKARSHPKSAPASNRRPRRSRRHHEVYAIKLTDEGMKAFDDEHFHATPEGLDEQQFAEWWHRRRQLLWVIVPMECTVLFDLPHFSGRNFVAVHDGDELAVVVVLADNASRRTSALPSDDLVARVKKFMHQENDQPRWYRVARQGDEPTR